MTNEEREEIKAKYENLLKIKKEILKQKDEIKELEQNPIVRRYLELKERIESDQVDDYYKIVHLSNEMILEKVMESVSTTNTNNIYVYLATYQINREKKSADDPVEPVDYIVSLEDPEADYIEYMSIELDEYPIKNIQSVAPDNRKEFEQNNIVLYPPDGVNNAKYYSEIRMMYFNTAIKYGCDKAVEKVLYKRGPYKGNK